MRAILTYHSLDTSGSPISLDPDTFRAHVRWLARAPVQVLTLEALVQAPPGQPAVALTFDDAFANFETEALPALREHGFPVTLFVPTGHVGGSNAWGGRSEAGIPTLPLLDWDGVARVAEAGVTLGAHTVSHPHLTACADDRLLDELTAPPRVLRERTGQTVDTLAYPYGDADARVRSAAERVCRLACSTRYALLADDDAFDLPRLDAFYFRDGARLEAFGTPAFARWVRFRERLRALRRVLRRHA